MPITLKHINYSDSDTIKLDKVNYNFDQLVANGGGPLGPQGAIGQSGPQGTTGQQGFQGPIGDIGNQGTPGPVTDNYWYKPPTSIILLPTSSTVDYIVPVYTPLDQFAPVVNIGYIDTEAQYGTKEALVGGKTPYQWLINRKAYSSSNLTLLNGDSLGNGIDFKLEKSLGKDKLTIGFINYSNSTKSIYKAAITFFKGTNISSDTLVVDDGSAKFRTNTEINSPVIVHRRLIIQDPTAGTNKIVISEDSTGLAKFKSVQELGGTVPYGTIVSILPSVFLNNNNFINSETVNPGSGVVTISVGKGVNNYDGWYLCHGKDWTDGTPAGTYPVPMLGNFNYAIEDNPFSTDPSSQGGKTTSNFRTHITGGSDIDMTATSAPGMVYNITSTVSTSTVQVGPGSGSIYKIKQLPQIIYLGRSDLYWFDPGSGQAPSVPVSWLLDDSNPNPSKLNPDPYPLGTVGNQPEGASYSFASEVETPNGYYWERVPTPGDITGVPTWATITSISLVPGQGAYPTRIAISISVSSHPAASQNQSPVNLGINTNQSGNVFIEPATVQITLVRQDLGTQYYTCSTPNTTAIQYNFNTGYNYQLVFTAAAGQKFYNSQFQGIFSGVSYTGGIFFAPPLGAGVITILNWAVSNNDTTLTVNLKLDQVPLTGYLTTQGYAITAVTYPTAPRITTPINAIAEITSSNGTGIVTKNLAIDNGTGAPVYLWIGIYQFYTGSGINAAVNAEASFTYIDPFLGFPSTQTISVSAPATTTNTQYYSTNSYQLGGGVFNIQSVTSAFKRFATSDGGHTVKLFWSTSSSPTAPKTQLIYSP